MTFSNMTLSVPSEMEKYLKTKDKTSELKRNAMLLYPYIDDRTISHGKAADILGISKYDLIEMYDQMGIAYLNMDISEAELEVKYWNQLKGNLR